MLEKQILVIDDEKNVRDNLKRALEIEGFNVELAINGEDGLKKLEEKEFPIVLLDMKLPGKNGIEVLREISQKHTNTKVLMITGYGSIETAVETLKLGAVDYLRKPFSSKEIREAVEKVYSRIKLQEREDKLQSFSDHLEYAKLCINNREFARAIEHLKKAITIDSTKPEPFNLLGVIMEMKNDLDQARKNYRAALALNPGYKPANENLERVCQFHYTRRGINLGEDDIDKRNQEGEENSKEEN